MSLAPKTFKFDHVLREKDGRPVARAILAEDQAYVYGEPIALVLLTAPSAQMKSVLGRVFYVDGLPYAVPVDVPSLRVAERGGKHMVNNFYLQPVSDG